MRLLKLDELGEPVLAKDYKADNLPPYAILSHTWGDQEVTFDDITAGTGKAKSGLEKIRFCGRQALKDGLAYFWVDSCCIDKRNSVELSEAINSMFRWYQNAERCYVYLVDVSGLKRDSDGQVLDAWEGSFRSSRWHTRGWTLQELIAPKDVSFYTREGHMMGDKSSLERQIHRATGIPVDALRGDPLTHFPINERLRWAANRQTTKPEDRAYCLFGIFNVFLPPIYGEGDHALVRLKEAITKHGNNFDHTLLPSNPQSELLSTADIQSYRRERLVALGFEQMDARRTTVKDAQATTCEWLLKHPIYVAWDKSSMIENSHRIMWINGKPGAGKSTLVKYALAQAQKNRRGDEILLSFFFNARGDELEKVTEGMYRTLLFQLLSAVPDLQQVPDDMNPTAATSEQQISWTLGQLQQAFASAVARLGKRPLTCFIDALDECEEQQVRDMVDFFEDLVESNATDEGCQLLVCFASRHYPTIHIEHGQRLILENETGHDDDIAKYIKRHLRAGSGNVLKEVHEQIQENANGVFLWAVLVVDILKKELERGRMFALKRQLQDLKKRLAEIPKGLSELFKDIIQRDRVNMGDLLLCLQWILFARRPLKREEFYFAMAAGLDVVSEPSLVWRPEPWDPKEVTVEDMTRFVLNSSKGLAELTKAKPHTVQFIHESVRDFLLRDGGLAEISPDSDGTRESSAHERLKVCCMSYLAADLSHLISFDRPLPKPSSDLVKEKRQIVFNEQFPFLQYAIQNLLYHANEAAVEISQTEFLANFSLAEWLKVTNLLERAEIRRHTCGAKLIYILAEYGCSRLIATTRRHGESDEISENMLFDTENRYGHALIAALANGHVRAVRTLLGVTNILLDEEIMKDPDFGKATRGSYLRKGEGPYSWAVRTGNVALAMLDLLSGPHSSLNVHGPALCALAIKFGRLSILESLLANGVDPNCVVVVDGVERTLLTHGAHQGEMHSVRLLLDKGATIDKTSNTQDNETALIVASRAGHEQVVDLLLQRHPNTHSADEQRQTALSIAARQGHSNVVQSLLAGYVNVDAVDVTGRTSLMLAATEGHNSTAQVLIHHGADLEATSVKSWSTPLMYAAAMGHTDMIQDLLEAGADINGVDKHLWTALFYAVLGDKIAAVNLLLTRGADIGALDSEGCTALFYALFSWRGSVDNRDMMELLLQKGEIMDKSTRHAELSLPLPAFHRAAKQGSSLTMRSLIASGADVNSWDTKGRTALMYALALSEADSTLCQFEAVKLLLDHGANVDAKQEIFQSATGVTALEMVASQSHLLISKETVQLLVVSGAHVPGLSEEAIRDRIPNRLSLDYQYQLMLLEQQNKRRLLMARDNASQPLSVRESVGSTTAKAK